MGRRALELTMARERPGKREIRLINMLSLIHTQLWKMLFGKPADQLQKCDAETQCASHSFQHITDKVRSNTGGRADGQPIYIDTKGLRRPKLRCLCCWHHRRCPPLRQFCKWRYKFEWN